MADISLVNKQVGMRAVAGDDGVYFVILLNFLGQLVIRFNDSDIMGFPCQVQGKVSPNLAGADYNNTQL